MPAQTQHSKLLKSANVAASGPSSSAKPQELPRNVERLVLDCFAEEQYDAGLTFLTEVLSPSVVPSFELMQQLTVIAISKPTYREPTVDRTLHTRSRGRPSKRPKITREPALPSHIHYTDVESARSLLLLHMQRPQFAQRFLDILPEGYVGKRAPHPSVRTSRKSRSRSVSDSPPLDTDGPAAQAAEWLFEDSTTNDVFGLLRLLPRSNLDEREFVMAPIASTDTVAIGERKSSSAQSVPEPTSPLTLLRNEMRRTGSETTLDVLFTERLVPLCEQESVFDFPTVWKLVQLISAAWSTQLLDCKTPGHHLASQLPQTKRANAPINEVDTILDLIFSGISVLDRYDAHAPRPDRSSNRIKSDVALDLLCLCARLGHTNILSTSALSSGMARRLYLVPLSGIDVLRTAITNRTSTESQDSLRSILAKAIPSYLEREWDNDDEGSTSNNNVSSTSLALARGFLLREIMMEFPVPTSAMKPTSSLQLRQAAQQAATFYALRRTISLLTLLKHCDPSIRLHEEYTHRISLAVKCSSPIDDLFDDSLSDDSRQRSASPREDDAVKITHWFKERGQALKDDVERYLSDVDS